jgi:hypothetical protein
VTKVISVLAVLQDPIQPMAFQVNNAQSDIIVFKLKEHQAQLTQLHKTSLSTQVLVELAFLSHAQQDSKGYTTELSVLKIAFHVYLAIIARVLEALHLPSRVLKDISVLHLTVPIRISV